MSLKKKKWYRCFRNIYLNTFFLKLIINLKECTDSLVGSFFYFAVKENRLICNLAEKGIGSFLTWHKGKGIILVKKDLIHILCNYVSYIFHFNDLKEKRERPIHSHPFFVRPCKITITVVSTQKELW